MSMTVKFIHAGYAQYLEHMVNDSMRAQAYSRVSGCSTHEGNPPGRWLGSGLQLVNHTSGDIVGKNELYSLIEKMENPVTGQRLIPYTSMNFLGMDAMFVAPKSFSLLWLLADESMRNDLDVLWNKALEEAIHQFEENGCYGLMGFNGIANVKLTGFAIAAYDHYTNRNGEANYHTHAVISPLSFHTNGIVVVLNQQSVLAAKEFINMYHSQILRDITRRDMGLQWEQRQSVFNPYISVWEIKQIPDKLIRATSSRSFAIEQKLNRLTQEFIAANGREPTRRELSRLEKKAWATTRRHKTEDTRGPWFKSMPRY